LRNFSFSISYGFTLHKDSLRVGSRNSPQIALFANRGSSCIWRSGPFWQISAPFPPLYTAIDPVSAPLLLNFPFLPTEHVPGLKVPRHFLPNPLLPPGLPPLEARSLSPQAHGTSFLISKQFPLSSCGRVFVHFFFKF